MLIAAAVCPHPPLLVPAATGMPGAGAAPAAAPEPGRADAELARLRTACHQAVAALLAERPGLIAVAGGDPGTAQATQYPPRAPGRIVEPWNRTRHLTSSGRPAAAPCLRA